MMSNLLILAVLLFYRFGQVYSACAWYPDGDEFKQVCDTYVQGDDGLYIPSGYDNLQVPKGRAKGDEESDASTNPTLIDVALQVQRIREIVEAEQKIIIDVDVMVHWHDYGLFRQNETTETTESENLRDLLKKFEKKQMNETQYKAIWKPDIFIERVDKIWKPELMTNPSSVRYISQSSSIIYTTSAPNYSQTLYYTWLDTPRAQIEKKEFNLVFRASVKMDCEMDFEYYPADTQTCVLDLRSFQSDANKMKLRWNPGAYLVNTNSDDNFDLKLSNVTRRKLRIRGIDLTEAEYDVLQLIMSMRRRLTYHLLQTYLPSALLVIITWLGFLIPEGLIEGRIGISLTTLLTLTAMFSSVRENTPVVSYVRAIDIWMAYCISTVFLTLLQFTFFVWLRHYKIAQRKKKLESLTLDLEKGEENSIEAKKPRAKKLKNMAIDLREGGAKSFRDGIERHTSFTDDITSTVTKAAETTAKILNKFALGFFVLSFVIFNTSYWTWLMILSKHFSWEVNCNLNGGKEDNLGFFGEIESFTNQFETTKETQIAIG